MTGTEIYYLLITTRLAYVVMLVASCIILMRKRTTYSLALFLGAALLVFASFLSMYFVPEAALDANGNLLSEAIPPEWVLSLTVMSETAGKVFISFALLVMSLRWKKLARS